MKKNSIWSRLDDNALVVDCCEEAVRERYSDVLSPDAVVRIPQAVIRRQGPKHKLPPIGAMTAARRGAGDTRARLYLWLFVLASDQPQAHARTGKSWARLLNLLGKDEWDDEKPLIRAVKRVRNAVDWFQDNGLITNPKGFSVGLLDPRTNKPYRKETPEELEERLDRRARFEKTVGFKALWQSKYWEGRPLDVPVSWWFNGTISALKGVELACLLVMWDQTREASGRFRVPRITNSQYGLLKGRWQRGLAGLEKLQFVTRHEIGTAGIGVRYEYEVDWAAISAKRERRTPERSAPISTA